MSKPSSFDSLEYERYVDGLRQANAAMAAAIRNMIDAGDDLIAAIDGSTDQFEPEAFPRAMSFMSRIATTAMNPTRHGMPRKSALYQSMKDIQHEPASTPAGSFSLPTRKPPFANLRSNAGNMADRTPRRI
jgi:hypothetical protein